MEDFAIIDKATGSYFRRYYYVGNKRFTDWTPDLNKKDIRLFQNRPSADRMAAQLNEGGEYRNCEVITV